MSRNYRRSDIWRTICRSIILTLLFLMMPATLYAAPFTPGNIVVYRVGSGSGSLVNTGNPVYLDEYTPTGSLVQSISLPTSASGQQMQLVASGTATSEGLLTLSTDRRYLLLTGYAATIPYASSLSGTTSATVARVIGRVDVNGNIDTSTALTDFSSGNSPRGAASVDGTTMWAVGGAGTNFANLGATTSTLLVSTNSRQVHLVDGQLYISSGSTGVRGVNTVGTGLPTTGGQIPTRLPGLTDTTNPSTYGFFLVDLDATVSGVDTLYVADDGAGALRKFSLVSGSWTANGTVGVDADDYRGLTGVVSGSTVTLYATRKGGSGTTGGGELVKLVDSSGYNGTFSGTPTLLASASSNTALRGVALVPIAVDTPPRVTTTTPAANATDVVTNSTIVLNFSESVDLTANAATLECPSGTAVTLAGLPASDVISVTLTPGSVLPNATVCTATVVAAAVTDNDGTGDPLDGDNNGTGGDNYVFSFTTVAAVPPPQPPTISALVPADNATNVAVETNLSITFSEAVQRGTGTIALKLSADDSVVESFDAATTSLITITDTEVTINPTNDLAVGAGYYVQIDAGAFKDVDNNNFAGITDNSTWNFTTIPASQAFPLAEGFDSCALTGWQIVSVDTDTAHTWSCNSSFSNLDVNGFGDSAAANEWFITPPLNMNAQSGEALTFSSWTRFLDNGVAYPQVRLKYSTDYSGSGDPTSATWTEISGITWSPANSQQWTNSGSIALSAISGTRVYFAWHYTSSGTANNAAANWRLDAINFAVDITAPLVSSLNPADGATGVAVSQDLVATFDEAVQKGTGNLTIHLVADNSVVQTIDVTSTAVTVSGTQVTINPPADLAVNTAYYVNIATGAIKDVIGNHFAGISDATTWNFTTAAPTITKINTIQGSSSSVTGVGPFVVEAIVVGDYQTQGSGQLTGFFLQEEDADADADPATSEGIFIFCGTCPTAVAVGDKVQVTGSASEYFNMSQLTASTAGSVVVLSSGNTLPTPATIELPVPGLPTGDLTAATAAINAYYEPFEGMLVTFPDTLTVSEYFELARYGQVILSEGGRPRQFTDANAPSVAELVDHEIDLGSRTVILDDTDNRQNRPVDTPNTAYYHPVPGLSTSNFFRGGDTITNLTGVLHWSFAGQTGTDAWRIRPVTEQYSYAFNPVNTRTAAPNVGGSLKVASFNVLNYFLTVDTTSSSNTGACGASATLDCRGADSTVERDQQQAKLTAALAGLNADIFGLIELENTPNVDPLAEIVADLNAATSAGTYATIDTGVIGTDAIKVGLIYKPSLVTPVGAPLIDTNAVHNRPPVAQLFQTANGGRFTVVVNHFKSKGCTDATGADLDQLNGQGCYNAQRVSQANALLSFVTTIVNQTGDNDILLIGDLNSYAKEDPITTLVNGGFTNLVAQFGGAEAYSYVFDGQLGYLDHALASASLVSQVTGTADWHINADEIPLFDYNDTVKDTGESTFEKESDVLPLYAANEFRTSDHDPVVIGLDLAAPEIAVIGNNVTIVDGATAPSVTDGTDFGSVEINSDPVTHTFIISNAGGAQLSGVSVDVTGDAAFTLVGTVPVTVAANAMTAVQVTFDPSLAGVVTATVTIASNDINENPYTFVIGGTGTEPPAPALITIVLDTQPDIATDLSFSGRLGSFTLDDPAVDDGDAYTNTRTFSVAQGVYTVRRNNGLNWFTTAIVCTPETGAVIDLPQRRAILTVNPGDAVTCTFTVERGATIRTRVFNDLVRNGRNLGKRNAGDPWLEGWELSVATSPTTTIASGLTSATSVTGTYEARFPYLRAGSYTVCVTVQEGWTNSEPSAPNEDYGKPCKSVTLAPGQAASLLFGVYQPAVAAAVVNPADEVITDEDQLVELPADPAENETPGQEGEGVPQLFLPLIVNK